MSDRDAKLLQSFVAQLAEHFDSVQIICTRYDAERNGTFRSSDGAGNYFARYGSVKEWIIQEESQMDAKLELEEDE